MPASLILFTGTGTGIGKTFLAVATVRAFGAAGARVIGFKPVESGVTRNEDTDGYLLDQASTFHVKPSLPLIQLAVPVSPHVAARAAGTPIDVARVKAAVETACASAADAVVVELPGGLFSPLTDTELAVDLVRALTPRAVVLVAPDRLGVLHEVLATTEAARARGVKLTHVLLSPARAPDASSGTNARELRRFLTLNIIDAAPFGESAPASAQELVRQLREG